MSALKYRIYRPVELPDGKMKVTCKPGNVLLTNSGTTGCYELHVKIYNSKNNILENVEYDLSGCRCGDCLKEVLNTCECELDKCLRCSWNGEGETNLSMTKNRAIVKVEELLFSLRGEL